MDHVNHPPTGGLKKVIKTPVKQAGFGLGLMQKSKLARIKIGSINRNAEKQLKSLEADQNY